MKNDDTHHVINMYLMLVCRISAGKYKLAIKSANHEFLKRCISDWRGISGSVNESLAGKWTLMCGCRFCVYNLECRAMKSGASPTAT